MKRLHGLFLTIFLLQFGLAQGWATTNDKPVVDQYVSVGDNWFLGRSMAVDSDTAIRDVFDFFKNVFNSERIYWRGLQAAVATDQLGAREDNFMYAGAFDHFADLIDEDIERRAVEIAHEEGLELWGVTQFGDYGVTADTPNFNEYPGFWEAKLRQENPEWIPTDKYGYRKQGGVIELAYPEARKALVDLHVELIESAGYDGIIFMSYAENFSMRFQDEFGYSEPIVQEFKRRHGIDIRTEPFNKFATRQDWYRLRGEYVTAFMEELREALGEEVKIGVWLNPIDPRKPMVWATLPQEYYTIGIIHMDIDKWVRDGIVDELGVYGGSSVRAQDTTLDEMLFLSRDTDVEINFITSNPFAMSRWKRFYELGMRGICSLGDEIQYLNRCMIPEQTKNALQSGTIYEKMKFLSQVIEGHSSIDASEILPLLDSPNVILQRLTLQALGKIGDPASVPAIESALFDPEQGVRSMAIYALGYNQGPNSLMAIEACMEEYGNHHLLEMTRNSIPRFSPVPYDGLHQMLQNPNIMVRRTAMYSLSLTARPEDLPYIEEALYDDDRYVAFLAARSLGMPQFRQNELAHEIMLNELNHPDPAIQNRVATSVGDLAYHGYDGPLRSQMLEALRSNFLELGTGTDRIDSEWGHRAIGNAMIGFGPEGEAELADLKATADDPRIRELAWQVIYFREKTSPFANEFNIITEKENEEAYRQRPVSLKNLRIDYLNQDFDDSRIFQPDSDIAPTVGDVHTKGGRWGGFGKNGAFIENKIAKSGRQSLHLKRGGSQVIGWTTNGPTPGWDFVTELWIQRNDVGSFSLRIMDDTKTNFLSILVDGDGRIRLSNPEGSPAWVPTDLTISPNEWTLLKITFEVSAGFITIQSGQNESGTPNSITIPFEGPNSSPTRILFTPNVPEDSSVFIDDIAIYEVR
tara:strand:+ start:21819 stop:24578 length:2760 start_codon:yes stop_codon:yes gene_type:complete